jgi:hypothetical protein
MMYDLGSGIVLSKLPLLGVNCDNILQAILQYAAPVKPGVCGCEEFQIHGPEDSRLPADSRDAAKPNIM